MNQLIVCFVTVVASCVAHPAVFFRPCFCNYEPPCMPMQQMQMQQMQMQPWNPFFSMMNPFFCPMQGSSPSWHPETRRIVLTLHRSGSNSSEVFNTTSAAPIATEPTVEEINLEETTGSPSTLEPADSLENMISKDDTLYPFMASDKGKGDEKSEANSTSKESSVV